MPKRRESIDALIDAHVWLSQHAQRFEDFDAAGSRHRGQNRESVGAQGTSRSGPGRGRDYSMTDSAHSHED